MCLSKASIKGVPNTWYLETPTLLGMVLNMWFYVPISQGKARRDKETLIREAKFRYLRLHYPSRVVFGHQALHSHTLPTKTRSVERIPARHLKNSPYEYRSKTGNFGTGSNFYKSFAYPLVRAIFAPNPALLW